MKLLSKYRRANNYLGDVVPIGWHTPTYSEMYYILNSRSNASNLRTLGCVQLGDGTCRNGCFLLPDDWVLPTGVSMTITTLDFTTNNYSLVEFDLLENAGAVFFPTCDRRNGVNYQVNGIFILWTATSLSSNLSYSWQYNGVTKNIVISTFNHYFGMGVRLCKFGSQFSVSATQKIDFAKSNIKYHCLRRVWALHEHSYDIIGIDNVNISDTYDGWIDLFGFGTSGVNYSPTLHTINNADYANGDLLGTPNDWGINF